MAREKTSGPAQKVESRPPSEARAGMIRPCATSASSRSARYRLDLPTPLAPVTTFSRSSPKTTLRKDR